MQAEVRAILKATAARENVVESAHNAVMESYHAEAAIRDDETAGLDEREAVAREERLGALAVLAAADCDGRL